MPRDTNRVHVIDSHTGGEPTRLIVGGGPDLGGGPLAERLQRFRSQFDHFRSAVVNEPRGSDAAVGALLCAPADPSCAAGLIFFNNVGYIGMCGHGAIGAVVTLAWMGRIGLGAQRIETPVGVVEAELRGPNTVEFENVPSHRLLRDVTVFVEGFGDVRGDIAWGGNWFFLTDACPASLDLSNLEELKSYTWRVRRALKTAGVRAPDGHEIDHIELFAKPRGASADARNFVLCPGGAYDRSPCGTGTSAKLACLYADGRLREGQTWRQESITGSIFEGSVSVRGGAIYPRILGSAYVTAEAHLILDEADPLRWGLQIPPVRREVSA